MARIDYWLLTLDIASWATVVTHFPRTLSDHSPVLLQLKPPNSISPSFSWRLPAHSLMVTAFKAEVRDEILNYFETNKASVDSSSTLWEAFKVVIRGVCISKQSGVLKSLRSTLSTLEHDIQSCEQRYYTTGDITNLAEIRTKLTDFQEAAEAEVKYLGTYTKARQYGEGDRPGRTLANTLKHRSPSTYITELKGDNLEPIRGQEATLAYLTSFYSTLYSATQNLTHPDLAFYLQSIALLWLDNDDRAYLDEPFTAEDITSVIGSMANGKAPGTLTFLLHISWMSIRNPLRKESYLRP